MAYAGQPTAQSYYLEEEVVAAADVVEGSRDLRLHLADGDRDAVGSSTAGAVPAVRDRLQLLQAQLRPLEEGEEVDPGQLLAVLGQALIAVLLLPGQVGDPIADLDCPILDLLALGLLPQDEGNRKYPTRHRRASGLVAKCLYFAGVLQLAVQEQQRRRLGEAVVQQLVREGQERLQVPVVVPQGAEGHVRRRAVAAAAVVAVQLHLVVGQGRAAVEVHLAGPLACVLLE